MCRLNLVAVMLPLPNACILFKTDWNVPPIREGFQSTVSEKKVNFVSSNEAAYMSEGALGASP